MAVVTVPSILPSNHRRRWITLVVVAFFGLLSLAAVLTMRVECRNDYLLAESGGYLLYESGERIALHSKQCRVVVGRLRLPLPAWTQAIVK
jgi:hypothetical protein